MPFVSSRTRTALASEYVPAADFKAFATNINGVNAFVTAQPSEEAARSSLPEWKRQKPRSTACLRHGRPAFVVALQVGCGVALARPVIASILGLAPDTQGRAAGARLARTRMNTGLAGWVQARKADAQASQATAGAISEARGEHGGGHSSVLPADRSSHCSSRGYTR